MELHQLYPWSETFCESEAGPVSRPSFGHGRLSSSSHEGIRDFLDTQGVVLLALPGYGSSLTWVWDDKSLLLEAVHGLDGCRMMLIIDATSSSLNHYGQRIRVRKRNGMISELIKVHFTLRLNSGKILVGLNSKG